MRVFYDTNVLLSSILWTGEVYRTHLALVERGHTPVTSERVIREALDVVARKFAMLDARKIEAAIRENWEIVPESGNAPSTKLRDPDDEGVLADAESAGVELLLSGDRDLLDARKEITTLVVLSARDFQHWYLSKK